MRKVIVVIDLENGALYEVDERQVESIRYDPNPVSSLPLLFKSTLASDFKRHGLITAALATTSRLLSPEP